MSAVDFFHWGKKTTVLSYCLYQQGAVPLELWTHFISNQSLALEYFTVQLLVRLCFHKYVVWWTVVSFSVSWLKWVNTDHSCALSTKMQLPIYFSLSLFCLFSASPVHLGSNSSNSSSRSFQEIYNFKRWLLKVCLMHMTRSINCFCLVITYWKFPQSLLMHIKKDIPLENICKLSILPIPFNYCQLG